MVTKLKVEKLEKIIAYLRNSEVFRNKNIWIKRMKSKNKDKFLRWFLFYHMVWLVSSVISPLRLNLILDVCNNLFVYIRMLETWRVCTQMCWTNWTTSTTLPLMPKEGWKLYATGLTLSPQKLLQNSRNYKVSYCYSLQVNLSH